MPKSSARRTAHGFRLCAWALLTLIAGTSTPEAPPADARAMLEQAAEGLGEVNTLRFKLQLSGAPAFIDDSSIISFVSADGSYVAPDQVQAKVSAAVLGVPGQIDVVAVGDQQYYKHIVLTGNRWLNEQFSPGFNAETLIRSDAGIKRALRSLTDIVYNGVEDLYGTSVHHIHGNAPVADISAVTVGLIRGEGQAQADIYLNVETGRVERFVMVQPETATDQQPQPTTWTMELFDYNSADISIATPEVETPEADATPGLTPGVPGLGLPTGTAPR
jgi:hypothetical protein